MRRLFALLVCLMLLPAWGLSEDVPVRLLGADDPLPALGDPDKLEVHLINVGSADCILLRVGGLTMMVDSGNLSEGDLVLDYLHSLGIERLDCAFLSHPHNDHLGGYVRILEEVPADSFLLPAEFADFHSEMADRLDALLIKKRIPTLYMTPDQDGISFGGATLTLFQWLSPRATVNDRSMLMHVRLGKRSILLAADVENNGQKELALAHGDALAADILKMPHHGLAAFMREFHQAVGPSLATFSNSKHRIEKTLTLTEQRGIPWLLTTKGSIIMVTDGDGPWEVYQIPGGL